MTVDLHTTPRFFKLVANGFAICLAVASLAGAIIPTILPDWVRNRFMEEYIDGALALRVQLVCLFLLSLVYLTFANVSRWKQWACRIVGPATPGTLGAIRMLVCLILLVNTLWEDLADTANLPHEMRVPLGINKIFHSLPLSYSEFMSSHTLLNAWQWLTIFLLTIAMVGFFTRVTVPLAALSYLVCGGVLREYTHNFHTCLIPTYCLIVLAFSPCGDGWSLDRLLSVARGVNPRTKTRDPIEYGWWRFSVWVVIAVPYMAAGLSKLVTSGIAWLHPNSMREILFTSALSPGEFDFGITLALRTAPDAFFVLLAVAGLFGELLFPVVLFSRRARLVFPAMMCAMHIGIFVLQGILFFDLIVLQAVFYDWRVIRRWVSQRVGGAESKFEMLYDGHCHLCQRTVSLVTALDLFERLQPIDVHKLPAETMGPTGKYPPREVLLTRMHLIRGDISYGGFYCIRRLATLLPIGWPIAFLLYVPGVSLFGEKIYDWVALRRHGLFACGPNCEIPRQKDAIEPSRIGSGGTYLWNLSFVFASATTLMFAWAIKAEYYPTTSMNMFSKCSTEGKSCYYKVLVHFDGGRPVEAEIQDLFPSLFDGRYRDVVLTYFDGETSGNKAFFNRLIEEYNKKDLHAPVSRIELQRWVWDFENDPNSLTCGSVVDSLTFIAKR